MSSYELAIIFLELKFKFLTIIESIFVFKLGEISKWLKCDSVFVIVVMMMSFLLRLLLRLKLWPKESMSATLF